MKIVRLRGRLLVQTSSTAVQDVLVVGFSLILLVQTQRKRAYQGTVDSFTTWTGKGFQQEAAQAFE
jgi:hypothetical protein